MALSVAWDCLVFGTACFGLGLWFATCLGEPGGLDRLSLGLGAAIVVLYLAAFTGYLTNLPPAAQWLPPAAGLVMLVIRRRQVIGLWRDETVRGAGRNWALLAAWCLGWQALIASYSGGGWSGDWQEHYDRAQFFLQHWPTDQLFINLYSLPARPPLQNLVIGGWLGLTGGKFFHFQVFSTLLATLVYFPLAGLVHRLQAGPRPQALLLVLLMCSPLLVQNATFPWTKLLTACFILLAADWLTRPTATETARALVIAPVALAAALLTHYSAAIWTLALGIAWLAARRGQLSVPANRRHLLLGVAAGTLLFMTWLGWSLKIYGAAATFTANSTASFEHGLTARERMRATLGNAYHTLLPTWLWEGVPASLQQPSPIAQLRDRWFFLYQLDLPFAFGLTGAVVLSRLLLTRARGPAMKFWLLAVPLLILIGAAVHPPNTLGLTHIALQPLVLLGLAWLAANARTLPRFWVCLWAAGLAWDFVFGIALQFGVQSLWLDRWLDPGRAEIDYIRRLSQPAAANYYGKLRVGALHLADGLPPYAAVLLLITSAGLALTALRSSGKTRAG